MPRSKKADDLQFLQGSWSIASLEIDGQAMSSEGPRLIVDGDKFRAEGMGADYAGNVRLDAARTPKSFDLHFTSGPEKGNMNLGIYELDGDNWKICLDMTGARRPAAFASGKGVALEILKRTPVEAARAKVPELAPGGPTEDIQGEWALVACISEGTTLPLSMTQAGKRVATAREITVTMGPQVIVRAKYSVNRANRPNTIDYVTPKGQLQYGIFEVEGDQLKTCFASPGKPRPTDFISDHANKHTFTEWKRV